MAENFRQNMKNGQEEAELSIMEKNMKAGELKIQKKNADNSISRLVDNYLDAETKLGPDHFRTQMLKTFVDIVTPLKDVADTMLDMQEALGTVSTTIGLIDDTMKFMYSMMEVNASNKYTFMRKLRDKRKLNKFMKNNNARMSAVMNSAMAMTSISQSLQQSLGKLSLNMKKQTIKQQEKQEKNKKKNAGLKAVNENKNFFSTSSDKLIEERRKQRGMSAPTESNANGGQSTAPSAKSSGGIDDIVG